MKIGFSKIVGLVSSKSTIAGILVTPLVAAGMGLLAFQTYSLVTGKSLKDLNFEIGKLWKFNEPKKQQEISPKDVVYNVVPFTIPKKNEPEEKLVQSVAKIKAPKIFKGKVDITPVIEQTSKWNTSGISRDKIQDISSVSIGRFSESVLVKNYTKRLENDFLIDPNIKVRKGKWYIGASFAPTLSYRTLKYKTNEMAGVAIANNRRYTYGLTETQRNSSDKSVTGFNIGIEFGRSLFNRLSIYSGFNYTGYGEQLVVFKIDESAARLAHSTYLDQSPIYEAVTDEKTSSYLPYTNNYRYIEIPIGLALEVFNTKDAVVSVKAGVALQKLDHVNSLVYDFNTDYYYWVTDKDIIHNKFGLAVHGGVNISQFVTPRLEFFANPFFSLNTQNTFSKEYPVSQKQYASGLNLGFKHHLF